MSIQENIQRYNRDPSLSPWFQERLTDLIYYGVYHNNIADLSRSVVSELAKYKIQYGIDNIVLGMSGGIDSAVTAALFKNAGWNVTGVVMPIHQNPEETNRGIEACNALGIKMLKINLTDAFDNLVEFYQNLDVDFHKELVNVNMKDQNIRKGNIRARLRMITLYNLASKLGGCVASTDNFSELAAGFWTLHGDVGDVSPIQAMTKSWEIPALAEYLGVPQSIVEAKPTDGLGIADGDEDQFGFSYLEFDIALFSLMRGGVDMESLNEQDKAIVQAVADRVRSTTYKRANPFNLVHPFDSSRYEDLEQLDIYLRS
jgi:nicotinamide-nucleotide amidase